MLTFISAPGGWQRGDGRDVVHPQLMKKTLQLFYIKRPDWSFLALSGCSVCECGELVVGLCWFTLTQMTKEVVIVCPFIHTTHHVSMYVHLKQMLFNTANYINVVQYILHASQIIIIKLWIFKIGLLFSNVNEVWLIRFALKAIYTHISALKFCIFSASLNLNV